MSLPSQAIQRLFDYMKGQNYKVFEGEVRSQSGVYRNYDLNLIFEREINDNNLFDDKLYAVWRDSTDGYWQNLRLPCTTLAGHYYLKNPMRTDGTFIVLPHQTHSSHAVGLHRGYPALVQTKPLLGVRDNNKDLKYNYDLPKIYAPVTSGINIHRTVATGEAIVVDRWSAACHVIPNSNQWGMFWNLILLAQKHWGSSFTTTLIHSTDLK